jgi:hypothetical protein
MNVYHEKKLLCSDAYPSSVPENQAKIAAGIRLRSVIAFYCINLKNNIYDH